MRSGYKILWTEIALAELAQTIKYLQENFTEKELTNLAVNIEGTLKLISVNPFLFPYSDLKKGIRRVVITKYNTLYYRIKGKSIEILSFFSNRQSPEKRSIK